MKTLIAQPKAEQASVLQNHSPFDSLLRSCGAYGSAAEMVCTAETRLLPAGRFLPVHGRWRSGLKTLPPRGGQSRARPYLRLVK
jgi:hypothetical protein